jgi:hypothetical protein
VRGMNLGVSSQGRGEEEGRSMHDHWVMEGPSLSQIGLDHLDVLLEEDESCVGVVEPAGHIVLEVVELGDETSHRAIDTRQHLQHLVELLLRHVFSAIILRGRGRGRERERLFALGWRRDRGDDGLLFWPGRMGLLLLPWWDLGSLYELILVLLFLLLGVMLLESLGKHVGLGLLRDGLL